MQTDFQTLIKKIQSYDTETDIKKIKQAFEFSKKIHKNHKRDSGEAYITHPIAVAILLTEYRANEDEIIAAILHDVLEDSNIHLSEIEEKFGRDVALLVDGVTKLTKIPRYHYRLPKTLRKMFLLMEKNPRIALIKLLDRLHNMKTLSFLPAQKRLWKAEETFQVYLGLAEKLNLWKIKKELEDLCFFYLDHKNYDAIRKEFQTKKKEYEKNSDILVKKFQALFHRFRSIEIEKQFFSYLRIFERKKQYNGLSLLTCLYINIITKDKASCYQILGIIHEHFHPKHNTLRDYFATPKPNGYQAIHTTVFTEFGPIKIHIHTEESLKHSLYGNFLEKHNVIPRLINLHREITDDLIFQRTLTEEIFGKSIKVYTLQGDEIELPYHATVLDFLISKYQDKALFVSQIRVANKEADLLSKLRHNDVIDVVLEKKRRPVRFEWLNNVKSYTAKNFLKDALGGEKNVKYLFQGLKEFKRWKNLLCLEEITKIRDKYEKNLLEKGLGSFEECLIKVGSGKMEIENFLENYISLDFVPIFKKNENKTYTFVLSLSINDSKPHATMVLPELIRIIVSSCSRKHCKENEIDYAYQMNKEEIAIRYFFSDYHRLSCIMKTIAQKFPENTIRLYPFFYL